MSEDHEASRANGEMIALQILNQLVGDKVPGLCPNCVALGAGVMFIRQFIGPMKEDEAVRVLRDIFAQLITEKIAGDVSPASYSGERLN